MQGSSADSAVCGYGDDDLEDEDCCVICLDSPKEVMFMPCGHTVRPTACMSAACLLLPQLRS